MCSSSTLVESWCALTWPAPHSGGRSTQRQRFPWTTDIINIVHAHTVKHLKKYSGDGWLFRFDKLVPRPLRPMSNADEALL